MRYTTAGRRDAVAILVDQGMSEREARAELERQARLAEEEAQANARNARVKAAARERAQRAIDQALARWAKAAGPDGDLVAQGRESIAALEAELRTARAALGAAQRRQALARRQAAQAPEAAPAAA